jgi:hypothetical protein
MQVFLLPTRATRIDPSRDRKGAVLSEFRSCILQLNAPAERTLPRAAA